MRSYAGSEDVYLAEVEFPRRGGEEVLARVVDDYAAYEGPISSDTLKSAHYAQFRLLRDATCDRVFADMPLRTAPGDPTALLLVPLQFQPELPQSVQPQQILPCYRVAR